VLRKNVIKGVEFEMTCHSILFQYHTKYTHFISLLGQFAKQFELNLISGWHPTTKLCIYWGHWQDEQAIHLNREAIQNQTPLMVFTSLEDSMYRFLVMPHQSPCLACLQIQQAIFQSIRLPQAMMRPPEADVQVIFNQVKAHMAGEGRAGVITQFSRSTHTILRQFRMVKTPTCTVCSSLIHHSAESYRSYLV
jgi:hypothetical protein